MRGLSDGGVSSECKAHNNKVGSACVIQVAEN